MSKDTKDVYLLILTNHEDRDVKIIDKETYDWLTSGNSGQPNPRDTDWLDKTCPLNIRKRAWKYHYKDENETFEDFYPYLTIGSWENDRMLWVTGIERNNKEFKYYLDEPMTQIIDDVRNEGYAIKGELTGLIY